jgi:hypothetical protein
VLCLLVLLLLRLLLLHRRLLRLLLLRQVLRQQRLDGLQHAQESCINSTQEDIVSTAITRTNHWHYLEGPTIPLACNRV